MPSPKRIAKQRLDKSKIMKLSLKDFNIIPEERPVVINPHSRVQKKPLYGIHVKAHGPTNPFRVQNRREVSTNRPIKRKVMPEPFKMNDVKTICDIHNLFYKDIEGRPVRSQRDHNKYMSQLRGILLSKADKGYAKDQILRIDEAMKCDEMGNWNKISQETKDAKTHFFKFVQLDFEKAERYRKTAEYVGNQLDEVNDNYAAVSYNYAKLKNEILVVCIKLEALSIYASFLQKVAPPWWRAKYDKNYVEQSSFFKNLFLDKRLSHADLVEAVSSHITNNYLYFNTPDQLHIMLEDMSNQCVSYMKIHIMSVEALYPLFTARTKLKNQVKFEVDRLQYLTSKFVSHIAYWEKKYIEFQAQFYKILRAEIQKLYSSVTVCKLMTSLQYVCNIVLKDQDDPNDSVMDLMGFIEKEYEHLRLSLDCLDFKVVEKATAEIMTEDIITMQRSERAQRTIKEWNFMRKALRASFEPPRYKKLQ